MKIIGINNILTYFSTKLFDTLFSHMQEPSKADIDNNLENAWREAFNEEPPLDE